jgi:cytochrome c-type biogenesis protein CcmH
MTLFFILAALLVVLCLMWLLIGLFRTNRASTDQEAVNITLARERRATLDAALADGSIDQASYDYEREQLEYDLAADLRFENQQPIRRGGQVAAAVAVAVFIPVAAGALYLQLGNPAAITQARNAPQAGQGAANGAEASAQQAPALAELLPQLEERLASAPDDVNGWRLLGRSYLSVNEFAKAQNALQKALALDENDVSTLAQLAEAIAMTRGGDLAGEPLAYLERSNAIDPLHEHTLWLLAIARQQTGDHEAALAGFDQLMQMARDNPEALATVEQMRNRSLEALGQPADVQADSTQTADAAPAAIVVSVSLSDEAAASVSPDSAVFIYARASDGPPMPLAVSRVTVQDLPLTVTLDDTMAMIPTMKLSTFPSVSIGARVSPSGNPIAQSGDWYVEQENIRVDEAGKISLTIAEQKP